MNALSKYNKALTAAVTGAVALLTATLPGGVTAEEWPGLAGGLILIVLGVWAVPNKPDATATDTSPVVVSQKDSSGTVTGTVVVPGPGATIREPEGD